jgi:hypothetical protein
MIPINTPITAINESNELSIGLHEVKKSRKVRELVSSL